MTPKYLTIKMNDSMNLSNLGILLFMAFFSLTACQSKETNEAKSPNETESSTETKKDSPNDADDEKQRINAAITAKNMNFRNNWENYIKIDHNDPEVDYTLGGISSFNVSINNKTSYMLDQVDINVEYIRKNGEICQDKTVTIFNIPAGSTDFVEAPSSVNGVKVNCSISKIISKKMHFCYPTDNGNPEDPYFCK